MKEYSYKDTNFGDFTIKVSQGSPLPYGVNIVSDGINFSVFSKNAESVNIVFFESGEEKPLFELTFDPIQNRTGNIWHIKISGLPKDIRYGYRLDGPYDIGKGLFFDKDNILIDPYARALTGGAIWGKPLVRKGAKEGDTKYLRRCFLPEEDFDWQGDRPINRSLKDTIIYELHVRGFSIDKSSKVNNKGTFKGLIEKIPYLKDLGITAVELMPIHEFDEEGNYFVNPDTKQRLKKYWGYNSIAFFAPKASYASGSLDGKQVSEFKEMVRELHKAGIEVILDVVFNHTGEGGPNGDIFSFRGFENPVYYMIGDDGEDMNYSGCGNTMNCNHPQVRNLIIDCLRYWVVEMHVDGFRFDLASILGRDQDGKVMKNPPTLEEIASDPILSETKIIAEAWDAAGLYQVGSFPAWGRWAEWNGKYRDDIRSFLRGYKGTVANYATRLSGSSDLYHSSGRNPYHSINFITSHDGFTLNDLFSYNKKHNLANGEDNRDGDNNNISFNYGVEGFSKDKRIEKLREKMIRNSFVILMLSQGTPMLLAGDEFRRTQQGNNNAYCQDNDISWINWSLLKKNHDIMTFCKKMIKFRKQHSVLRRDYFFKGEKNKVSGIPDISWHGYKAFEPDFSNESCYLGALISGYETESDEMDNSIFIAANMNNTAVKAEIPKLNDGTKWYLKVDTSSEAEDNYYEDGKEKIVNDSWIYITEKSIKVLISKD